MQKNSFVAVFVLILTLKTSKRTRKCRSSTKPTQRSNPIFGGPYATQSETNAAGNVTCDRGLHFGHPCSKLNLSLERVKNQLSLIVAQCYDFKQLSAAKYYKITETNEPRFHIRLLHIGVFPAGYAEWPRNGSVAIGKARVAYAQSFAMWQQAMTEFTCHDHSIIACLRHVYLLFFFALIQFVVNHTSNATPPERL